jgi:hypothetical protein
MRGGGRWGRGVFSKLTGMDVFVLTVVVTAMHLMWQVLPSRFPSLILPPLRHPLPCASPAALRHPPPYSAPLPPLPERTAELEEGVEGGHLMWQVLRRRARRLRGLASSALACTRGIRAECACIRIGERLHLP